MGVRGRKLSAENQLMLDVINSIEVFEILPVKGLDNGWHMSNFIAEMQGIRHYQTRHPLIPQHRVFVTFTKNGQRYVGRLPDKEAA